MSNPPTTLIGTRGYYPGYNSFTLPTRAYNSYKSYKRYLYLLNSLAEFSI